MACWDISCLLKLYVPEADSADLRAHALRGVTIATAAITRLELLAALHRKEAQRDLNPNGARHALSMYDADVANGLIVISELSHAVAARFEAIVERCFQSVPPIPLRTLDAIHLATATSLGESQMVATDKRLREAASSLGFSLYPPA